MKMLMLVLVLASVSGCSILTALHEANPYGSEAESRKSQQIYERARAAAAESQKERDDRATADREDLDRYYKSVGAPTLAERNQSSPENPQQTACIYYGNAYVQAINIRNQWSFADPKDSYNAALNHVRAILSKYPQFNAKAIVDNVFYNPNFRYPVGGNPLSLQMTQLCMKETQQASFKP